MQSTLFKTVAAALLMGSIGLAHQVKAEEAAAQVPPVSTVPRIQVGSDQTTLSLTLDFAKVLTFDQPARTIIIGNPGIIDGTMSDDKTFVLTGKSVGATNMIVLGEAGQEIANLKVRVLATSAQVTTVYHGGVQQVYSCDDTCRPLGKAEAPK